VATTIVLPLPPPAGHYTEITAEAWTGKYHHFCGFPIENVATAKKSQTTTGDRVVDEGCALVSVAGT
jgi:hypothetical protein